MTETWTWCYYDAERVTVKPALEEQHAAQEFPSQSDAESWLGEHWRELAAAGVAEVELIEADDVRYAMSLTASES